MQFRNKIDGFIIKKIYNKKIKRYRQVVKGRSSAETRKKIKSL